MLGAFLWRERYDAGVPSIFAADWHFVTSACRRWSALSKSEKARRPWPAFRDSDPGRNVERIRQEPSE